MTETRASPADPGGRAGPAAPGCLARGLLAGVAAVVAALLILYVYGVVVEIHRWIAVPREFGYDMMLYALLGGIAFATFVAGFSGNVRRVRGLGAILLAMAGLIILLHLYMMTQ